MRPRQAILMVVLTAVLGVTESYSDTGHSENMTFIGRWPGGPCTTSDVVGSIAYIADGAFLKIYDFSDPAAPAELGRVIVPGPIRGVNVQGGYAYLADWEDGLRVVDVSNPAAPYEAGFVDTPGKAHGIAVVGSYAYVADGYDGGLRIVDVSTPTAPQGVGFLDTASQARNVAVSSNYAYVADNWDGLRIIDVTDPTEPMEVGFLDTDDNAYDVAVAGNFAYVADRGGGLLVIDVSLPTAPSLEGSYTSISYVISVAVGGGFVYTSGQWELAVFDVSDPADPTLEGTLSLAGPHNGALAYGAGRAYVASIYSGYRAIDVTDPTTPVEVGYVESSSNSVGIDVQGDHAYLASYLGGLRILNVSDPSVPEEVGFYRWGFNKGAAEDVRVVGNYAYVANDVFGISVLDVSNPTAPSETGSLDLPIAADAIAVQGNYAYLTGQQGGATEDVFVVDISDPGAPAAVDSLDLPSNFPRNLAVQGDYLYVAAYEDFRIIDVSDPTDIVEVGVEDSHLAIGVAVEGDYAYVGAGGNRMTVLNVSDPTAPAIVGTGSMLGSAWGVAKLGSYAYVANTTYGVRVFDVSDPTAPVTVGRFDTADDVRRLVVRNGVVFATDWQDGIWIVELDPSTNAPDRPATARSILHPCVPNPFNPKTSIRYELARPSTVTLEIVDVGGRRIRLLRDGAFEQSGRHVAVWDGHDNGGFPVASGIYYCRLVAGSFTSARKMALVR